MVRGSAIHRSDRARSRVQKILGVLLGLAALGLFSLPAVASAAECTDTWVGPSEGTWKTAASWSAGHQPGSADVACIGSGKTVVVSEGVNQVAVVQGEGTLNLAATLELLSGTSSIGTFSQSSGTLKGPGQLRVSKLNWSAGTMTGSGSTVVSSGGSGTIGEVGSEPHLVGRTFVNEGTTSLPLTSTRFAVSEGTEIRNTGTFIVNSEYVPALAGEGTPIATFVNEGTLKKTAGTGTSQIKLAIHNVGSVEAGSGTLSFAAGGSSSAGKWTSSAGANLAFTAGELTFTGGSWANSIEITNATVKCEGLSSSSLSLRLGEGSLNISKGLLTAVSFIQTGGTLTGGGTLATQSLNWSYGTMSGSGSTVLSPGGNGTIGQVGSEPHLVGRRFINEGTTTVPLTPTRFVLSEGAEIRNLGTFIANSEYVPAISAEGTPTPTFVNQGKLQKTEGTGKTEIAPGFSNHGAIEEKVGTLVIPNHISVSSGTGTPFHAGCGDPVDCGTGNFTETQTDLRIGGRGVELDLTRTYSAQAAAAGATGIFGHGWTNSFGDKLSAEEGGAREVLTEASGSTVPFSKSGSSYLAPGWSRDTLAGSAEAGFTLTLSDQTKEKFSGAGRLESVTDRNANATKLTYNGAGRLEKITDPTTRTITLAYNAEGLVEKATDPMGYIVLYTYEAGNLKTVTLPGEAAPNWKFEYDGSHRMTSMISGRGGRTTNEYDGSSRVISQTDPAERTTTWRYEGFHTTITNKATGAVTDEWFNSDNQPISITRGFGTALATTESFTFTAAGLLASRTDGNGHATTYGYDAEANRTSERDAEGDETRWTFNGAHQLLTQTAPRGEKTTIERDANGNPKTISRPAPESKTQTVSYAFGTHGEVESMTDPLLNKWTYKYDSHGDRVSETDPLSDKRSWAFNANSKVTSTVSPRGNETGAEAAKFTTAIERDAQGRPIKITDPLGGATKYAYDADGDVESVIDPKGHKTAFTYDAADERTKIERPNKATEEAGYDGAGQLTSQTDGAKHKTTYVRNVLEQPVEIIDPLERRTVQTFDAAGNLKTRTDPQGRTTTYGYDKAERLKEVLYSAEATKDVTYVYDEDGDLTGMVDATGESKWEYDQLDRLIHAKNGYGETVGWAYNLATEPVGLTYPNGKSISRAYDKAGRLESVTDWLAHKTSFAYNRDSEPTKTTYPTVTGDVDEDAYDRADRMSGVTMKKGTSTLASLAYTRDPAGQLETLISKGLPGAEEETFGYDENDRLTKAGSSNFEYDAANDPTKAPGTTNVFDKASELESATGSTFAYDKEGERTRQTPASGPAMIYKYDQAGHLTNVERAAEGKTPAIAESFSDDGLGLLASRTVVTSTHHFVWDASESPEPLLADGEYSYVYGPGGMPIEQISTGEAPTYLHHDQLGSTRLLSNASGEAAGTFTYGPYGALTGTTGSATTALGYAGQYTLGQSGLQYLRARFYDPSTAQFMTRDPLFEATHEPFAYGADDPLRFKDPTGLSFTEALEGGGIPCLWCEAAHGVQELLEPSYKAALSGAGWVLENSFGAEELGETEDVPCAPPDLEGLSPKIERQIGTRGWTTEEIEEAYEDGEQVGAINKENGNPATRYLNPKTGKSVVIDNETGEIIHVGERGFRYGPESGDRP